MIPRRLRLKGFLSYRDEQELSFEGGGLWLLSGPNGSGKSSVFDAMTYALFGHHRGGAQNAVELIHKDENSLLVEFEFSLDQSTYRIKRTLKRGKSQNATGTQQITHATESGWEAVPDSTKKTDFDRWIHQHLGLTYETFTSSVLLLQGRAERLLDAKPAARTDVLAGIVDLERYQRLHARVNDRRLALRGQLEAMQQQVANVPEVSDDEYARCTELLEAARTAKSLALADVQRIQEIETEARRWQDAAARAKRLDDQVAAAEALLAESTPLESRYQRWLDLKQVLPVIHQIVKERAQVQESDRKIERGNIELADREQRKQKSEQAADLARKKREELKATLQRDETQLESIQQQVATLSGQLRSLTLLEQLQATLNQWESDLRQLPEDIDEQVRAAEADVSRLTTLARTLPQWERFHAERGDLLTIHQKLNDLDRLMRETKAKGESARQQDDELTRRFSEAQAARSQAEIQAGTLVHQFQQARDHLAELDNLTGLAQCRSCGQPLTAQHLDHERELRTREVNALKISTENARNTMEQAIRIESELSGQKARSTEHLATLRADYQSLKQQQEHLLADRDRLQRSLKTLYLNFVPADQARIARELPTDWSQTRYPTVDDVHRLQHEAAQLDLANSRLKTRQATLAQSQKLRSQKQSQEPMRLQLQKSLAGANPDGIREQHLSASAEEKALRSRIASTKHALEDAQRLADIHGQEAHHAATAIVDLQGKLREAGAVRQLTLDSIQRALVGLPSEWRAIAESAGMQDYYMLDRERDELALAGIDEQYRRLQTARASLAQFRTDRDSAHQEAQAFPPAVRRPLEEIRRELQLARQDVDARDRALADAEKARAILDGHRDRRRELAATTRTLDQSHQRIRLLTELLGRDRLQRYLIRKAERQIVDRANAVLDRLSGGQLFLRLVDSSDTSETTLDLECWNRQTGQTPIGVAFLSGSQRFRVAVALALGIGQYASRQYRPLESVIIDEGFGSLDRAGRQVMIQELQNLRGLMKCVLIVSHQDEFVDAFPQGYRFALVNGTTQVSHWSGTEPA